MIADGYRSRPSLTAIINKYGSTGAGPIPAFRSQENSVVEIPGAVNRIMRRGNGRPMRSTRPRFFIFGYFGWFNVGDDAIGLSVITELAERHPHATFTVSCNDPYFLGNFRSLRVGHNLETVGFEISAILQAILKSDVFIITGGTHLHDEDGPKSNRIRVFLLYTVITCFGRLIGRAPFLFGHGLGPLSSSWATMLARVILNNSKGVFVRDGDSFALAGSLGAGEKCVQGFDCSAALIKRQLPLSGTENKKNGRMIIGISLLPAHDIYSNDTGKDDDIVQSLAKCLDSIIKEDDSITVRLLAYRTGQRHSDLPLLEDLQKNTHALADRIELVQYDGDIDAFLGSVEDCSYCIGMRYHASVFAYLFNKPQIILDYMGKCRSLGKDIALNDIAIIPISLMVLPQFSDRVRSLLLEPGRYLADLPTGVAMMRTESMFDRLNDEIGTLPD